MATITTTRERRFKKRRDGQTNVIYAGGAAGGGGTGTVSEVIPDTINVDTINEKTLDAGVTIESVLIKDGLITNYVPEATQDGVGYARKDAGWVSAGLKLDYSGGTGVLYDVVEIGEALTFATSGSGLGVSYSTAVVGGVETKKFTFTFTPAGSYYDGWKTVGDSGSVMTTIPSNGELTFAGGSNINTVFTAGTYPNYNMTINLDSNISVTTVSSTADTNVGGDLNCTGTVWSNTKLRADTTSTENIILNTTQVQNLIKFQTDAATNAYFGYSSSGDTGLAFFSSTGTVRALMNDSGKFGIGTTTPTYMLEVVHAAGGSDKVRIIANSSGGIAGTLQLANSNTGQAIGAEAGRIEFYKDDPSTQGAGVVAKITAEAIDAGGTYNMVFRTGQDVEGTPVGTNGLMRFDYAGRLALGDGATGSYALNQITVDTSASGAYSGGGVIGDDLGYSGIKMYDATNGNMTIFNKRNHSSYGHIYLATGATPTVRLTINNSGVVHASSSITSAGEVTSYSSDMRLKKHVRQLTGSLEAVKAMRGVSYDWRAKVSDLGFNPSSKHDIGFIAQELQGILPEAVTFAPFDRNDDGTSKSGNDYLTVKPEKIIPVLVEAIKELSARVDKLSKAN